MAWGKLAELFVEVGTRDHTGEGLAAIKGRLSEFAGRMKGALTIPVAIGSTIAGAAITQQLYSAVQAASDLNETVSKTQQVFGQATPTVTKFADEVAKKYGLVKREVLDAASSFGLILKASGMTQQGAADLSTQLAMLAADASSFYNIPVAEALEKIRSGLVGEAEPLRALGVLLNEQAVNSQAAAMGYQKVGDSYSEAAKSAARAKLIVEGLSTASGDLDRTSDGLANRQRKLAGDWENMKADLGNSLIPAFQELINVVYALGGALDGAFGSDRQAQMAGVGNTLKEAAKHLVNTLDSSEKGTNRKIDEKDLLFGTNNMLSRYMTEGVLSVTSGVLGVGTDRLNRIRAARAQTDLEDETKAKAEADKKAREAAAKAAPPPANPPMSRQSLSADDLGMMSEFEREAFMWATSRQAAGDKARKGVKAGLEHWQDRVHDLEKSQRDKLAQGGVMGDQLSSINAMQGDLLNALPQKQLDEAKKQVKTLEEIKEILKKGDGISSSMEKRIDMVLAGPE